MISILYITLIVHILTKFVEHEQLCHVSVFIDCNLS